MTNACRAAVVACGVWMCICPSSPAQLDSGDQADGSQAARPEHPPFADAIVPDSLNAAARYLWLFKRFDERFTPLLLHLDPENAAFEFYPEREAPGTVADLREVLVEQQEWIRSLVEASKVEDFRLSYDADRWDAELAEGDPRWDLIKNSARAVRVLLADAIRLWHEGEHAEAGRRLTAACSLAWRISAMPSPTLNQFGAHLLVASTLRTLTALLAEGQPPLPEQQTRELLALLEKMDPRDPVNMRTGWQRNQKLVRAFVDEQLADGKVGDQLVELLVMSKSMNAGIAGLFSSLTKGDNAEPPTERELTDLATRITEEVESLSHQRVVAQLRKIDELAARIEKAWEAGDASDTLQTLQEECEADNTGLTALIIMSPRSTQRQWREGVDCVSRMRATLAARLPVNGD